MHLHKKFPAHNLKAVRVKRTAKRVVRRRAAKITKTFAALANTRLPIFFRFNAQHVHGKVAALCVVHNIHRHAHLIAHLFFRLAKNQMLSDDGGVCRNCAGTEFVVDYGCGECCCDRCGCVASRLMVASASYKQVFDLNGTRVDQAPLVEMYSTAAFSTTALDDAVAELFRNKNSAPYKRRTYFSERLSQWQMREPAIDRVDFKEIEDLYEEYNGGKYQAWRTMELDNPWRKVPIWTLDREFTKEDCRTLLWEIDRRRISYNEKPYFVKKYLVSFFAFLSSRAFCSAAHT